MRAKVLLEVAADDGAGVQEDVACFEKQTERSADLGRSIAEAKALPATVHERTVKAQAAAWTERHRCGPACAARRRSKIGDPVVFRTLYGDGALRSPRLHRCRRRAGGGPAMSSPLTELIPEHVASERLYLESRWSSLVPNAAAANLLAGGLPVASGANAATLSEHALRARGRGRTPIRPSGHAVTRSEQTRHAATTQFERSPALISGLAADDVEQPHLVVVDHRSAWRDPGPERSR